MGQLQISLILKTNLASKANGLVEPASIINPKNLGINKKT